MDLDRMTERLYGIPFDPSHLPDPMETSFDDLEARVAGVINELWRGRDQWRQNAREPRPIWPLSLRMTAMYLNMCDAFHGCGAAFMKKAVAGDESAFVEEYENCEITTRLGRASCFLARTVKMLRILGFRARVVAIGGDAHYHGMCEESVGLLAALKRV